MFSRLALAGTSSGTEFKLPHPTEEEIKAGWGGELSASK